MKVLLRVLLRVLGLSTGIFRVLQGFGVQGFSIAGNQGFSTSSC